MQRQSQIAPLEVPIGGWNTRDSLDNIPPSDAIEITNWIPDLGELRTRPGYTEHGWVGDVTSGAELVSNGGFESAGGGGADVFANWSETVVGAGTIAQSTGEVYAGTYSCAIGTTLSAGGSVEQNITTVASTTYTLSFRVYHGTKHDYSYPCYSVYDVSNGAYLIAQTDITNAQAAWTEVSVQFTTVAGGISTKITLGADGTVPSSVTSYFDAVTCKASVLADDIETLAVYESGTTNKLFGFTSTGMFDFSSPGAPAEVTLDVASTPYTNGRWQWVNFNGEIGFVNGTDIPKYYPDASGDLADLTLTGSGLTAANVIGVNVFKGRTWFWEDNSQDVWYSPIDTLGGALTKFPLSCVGQFGGNLICMATWTRDGGSGPDDFAVFIMSSGECIIYQGSSPALGGDWALVGIYDIGEPLSVRSIVKFGGDIMIITRLDYVALSTVLVGTEAWNKKSKVVGALRNAIGDGGSLWGWEATLYPKRQLAIFNIPEVAGTQYSQHVLNTVTGAWCKWEGITSHTWQVYDNRLFFASTDGYVYEFDTGDTDDGGAIESTLQTAWINLGNPLNKMFTAEREFYRVNSDVNVVNSYAVDYEDFESQQFPVPVTPEGTAWGSPWGSPWTAGDRAYNEWQSIGIYGDVISRRKSLSTKQRFRYLGSTWMFRPGERL